MPASSPPFHVMTKPVGPICNLACRYCFYLEKEKLYPANEPFRMSDAVLESYIRQYIHDQGASEVHFAWQGGEPTLLGVDFFRKVVDLQKKLGDGRVIHNAIQTNGTLLDDAWCAFLTEHHFLVGLSVDGPAPLHDRYRVDKRQQPTFDLVMRGLAYLKKHATEFNTLTVVNRANVEHPLEVYRFLKEIGSTYIQFIPLVERTPDPAALALGLDLALPPTGNEAAAEPVTAWSVPAPAYGEFLVAIFEEWVRHDVGRTFVQLFDVALENWMGLGSSLCVFAETCGHALALEHNGDVFACDHYVYPQYKLGNVMNRSLGEMVASPEQRAFGQAKRDALPAYCRSCSVRFACNGECPQHRFMKTPEGEAGLNYLCPAYKRFFGHIDPAMRAMAELLRIGQPAARIMDQVRQGASPSRNDACSCGSGRKYKQCCGRSA